MSAPIRTIISGVSGRMGRKVLACLLADNRFKVVAGLVSAENKLCDRPLAELHSAAPKDSLILADPSSLQADIVVDFSQPAAFNSVVDFCVMSETALVSGTTGLSQAQFDRLSQAGHFVPVLWAANFSLNIQIIKNLLQIFKQINKHASYQITETHHQHKKDAPSGTAIALAQSLTSSPKLKRISSKQFTLGNVRIESIREAEVPGTHHIHCDFPHETISLTHVAKDADLFVQGAVSAAYWLAQQKRGLYDLNAILLA